MRQFNYKYKSFFENKHGFINMVPHAKFLHPYMGFRGFHGYPTFQTTAKPNYSDDFCNLFVDKTLKFTHHVKMFFPEIRTGMVFVNEANYTVDSFRDDNVSVTTKVNPGYKYEEYVAIEDFVAEFTVDIEVKFGERNSITRPVEIYCNFIDVYVHNQKISMTVHDNNLLIVPYYISYRGDFPPEIARLDLSSANLEVNSDVTYGFLIDEYAADKLKERGIDGAKIDNILLETKKLNSHYMEFADAQSDYYRPQDIFRAAETSSKSFDKYVIKLPRTLFSDKMTLTGLPIFDSEVVMKCCKYIELGWCTPYLPMHGVHVPSECDPDMCKSEACKDQPQYEVRNKIIDNYLLLAEKSFQELDMLAGVMSSEVREKQNQNIIEGM